MQSNLHNIPFEPSEFENKPTEEEIQEKRESQHLEEERDFDLRSNLLDAASVFEVGALNSLDMNFNSFPVEFIHLKRKSTIEVP